MLVVLRVLLRRCVLLYRRVLEQSGVLVQKVDQHLQKAHLSQDIAEDGVVACQLQ